MILADYITKEIGREKLSLLIKNGLIQPQIATYVEIYEWHVKNGRSRLATAKHFKVTSALVGYAVTKMKQEIID